MVDVKICGLRDVKMLDVALDAGADMVGLVFFAKSPRHLDLDAARILADRARERVKIVALTVDASDQQFFEICDAVAPDWLQLHGRETPQRVAEVKARFGRPILKAIGVADPLDLVAARHYEGVADRLLYDAKPPKNASLPGGNGLAFDWRLLEGLPETGWMLSGGLTPENVAQAIKLTGAPGVDVSSGVEDAPGVKSAEKIRAFVAAARRALA